MPANRTTARRARAAVSDVLDVAGCDRTEDVLLVVSELVTNAVVHARSDVELVVHVDDAGVRVEVHDERPEPPVLRDGHPMESGGRGLRLVAALGDRWGTDVVDGDGKSVWCELGQPRLRSAG